MISHHPAIMEARRLAHEAASAYYPAQWQRYEAVDEALDQLEDVIRNVITEDEAPEQR